MSAIPADLSASLPPDKRIALSQFYAGHISAGELSRRLGDADSSPDLSAGPFPPVAEPVTTQATAPLPALRPRWRPLWGTAALLAIAVGAGGVAVLAESESVGGGTQQPGSAARAPLIRQAQARTGREKAHGGTGTILAAQIQRTAFTQPSSHGRAATGKAAAPKHPLVAAPKPSGAATPSKPSNVEPPAATAPAPGQQAPSPSASGNQAPGSAPGSASGSTVDVAAASQQPAAAGPSAPEPAAQTSAPAAAQAK